MKQRPEGQFWFSGLSGLRQHGTAVGLVTGVEATWRRPGHCLGLYCSRRSDRLFIQSGALARAGGVCQKLES